jgi:hypothetical protein
MTWGHGLPATQSEALRVVRRTTQLEVGAQAAGSMLRTVGCCREAGLVRTPWNSVSGALTTDRGVSAWLD